MLLLSLPARAVWIEIFSNLFCQLCRRSSLPARAVWIEISWPDGDAWDDTVTAREGGVD